MSRSLWYFIQFSIKISAYSTQERTNFNVVYLGNGFLISSLFSYRYVFLVLCEKSVFEIHKKKSHKDVNSIGMNQGALNSQPKLIKVAITVSLLILPNSAARPF